MRQRREFEHAGRFEKMLLGFTGRRAVMAKRARGFHGLRYGWLLGEDSTT